MDTFYNAIVSVSNYYNQVVLGNDTNIFGSNGTSTASMDASMIPTIVELAHAYQPSIIQDVGFVENKVRLTSHKCYDRNLGRRTGSRCYIANGSWLAYIFIL